MSRGIEKMNSEGRSAELTAAVVFLCPLIPAR